jgi:hypothetical protein
LLVAVVLLLLLLLSLFVCVVFVVLCLLCVVAVMQRAPNKDLRKAFMKKGLAEKAWTCASKCALTRELESE